MDTIFQLSFQELDTIFQRNFQELDIINFSTQLPGIYTISKRNSREFYKTFQRNFQELDTIFQSSTLPSDLTTAIICKFIYRNMVAQKAGYVVGIMLEEEKEQPLNRASPEAAIMHGYGVLVTNLILVIAEFTEGVGGAEISNI